MSYDDGASAAMGINDGDADGEVLVVPDIAQPRWGGVSHLLQHADDAMSRASDPDSDEMETETEVTEATPLVAAGNFWAKQPKQPQEGYSSVARTEVMLTAHGYTS